MQKNFIFTHLFYAGLKIGLQNIVGPIVFLTYYIYFRF